MARHDQRPHPPVARWLPLAELGIVTLLVGLTIASAQVPPLPILGLMLLFWLLRWWQWGHPSRHTPADLPIVLLLLMAAVSWQVTPLPEISHPQILRLLLGIGLFYALLNSLYHAPALVQLLPYGISGLGAVLALVGLVGTRWPHREKLPFIPALLYERLPLMLADSIHANVLGGILVFLLPIPLAMLLFTWRSLRGWQRLLLFAAVLLMGLALLLSQSRGALIALGAVGLLLASLRWRWGWLGIVLAGGIMGWLLLAGNTPQFMDTLTTDDTFSGFDMRVDIWQRGLYMLQFFPLTGGGMGTFMPIMRQFYPLLLVDSSSIPHVHQIFLQVALDLGIPGLLAWLLVLLIIIVNALRITQRGRALDDRWLQGLGAGLLAAQVALVVQGQLDAVLWGMVRTAPLVWLLWGSTMGIALSSLVAERRAPLPPVAPDSVPTKAILQTSQPG